MRAWRATRQTRRAAAHANDTCPDCGTYWSAHRWPGHGPVKLYRAPTAVFRDGRWETY